MQLGFVSAILPDLSLDDVLAFAADEGFGCVEVMCWPPGSADRRYAGVTHLDVSEAGARAEAVHGLTRATGVRISALGYYPNPLAADPAERRIAVDHLRIVIDAAAALGVSTVNTFVGRDPAAPFDANWRAFCDVWPPLVRFAADRDVRIGIENCPMLFTDDEWPGGKNLAVSPAVWRRMFAEIPDPHFGLNYDPSHMIWQQMDEVAPIEEFRTRLHHVHAKDARIDRRRLNEVGILAVPLAYHTPKLPGLGEVRWGPLFAALTDAGYAGPVCVEVEDRAYEGTLEDRKRALRQCAVYLRQFMAPAR